MTGICMLSSLSSRHSNDHSREMMIVDKYFNRSLFYVLWTRLNYVIDEFLSRCLTALE